MINCVAVDDEQAALDIMIDYIKDTPFLNLVAATTNPMEVVGILQSQEVDLVFADIQMPRMNGLNLVSLFEGKVKFIMTTGYQEYALQSFEFGVLDYLVKPFGYQRFLKAVSKMPFEMTLVDSPVEEPEPEPMPKKEEYIFVKVDAKGKFHKVLYRDVIFMEAQKTYASITTHGDRITTNLTLSDLEKRLPSDRFMRIHRSFIISKDRITGIEGDEVVLDKVLRIPIGDTYRETFANYIEGSVYFKEKDTAVVLGKRISRSKRPEE
ncbi:LytTR family DNA-binding domain-containing protein [Arcicella sp. LKC2W]|uniref:LytR/AlgR family response regulator transcription factor n=1 Tax=Arcicella sp. LKC2W TaxID=2984198 RepID=UPI002B208284|nr:LytTR family DNA-binding domain-containing protein [Arcicella sp. LKC2W]MEA5457986.1 LytTR family DNA-binding domain-containing protein [Arcicella sp. LKC2W]